MLPALVLATLAPFQKPEQDSGRPMPPEQAAYDVLSYELQVKIDPNKRRIDGQCAIHARMLQSTKSIIVDLDSRLGAKKVYALRPEHAYGEAPKVSFAHRGNEIRVESPLFEAGEEVIVQIEYGGTPREAPNPPWDGGFTWSRTGDGSHWIATSNQMQGGDLWWPCKDQPDDEPDEMTISVTVPAPLVAATNGRPTGFRESEKGWLTYDWAVTTPINAYGVALNIAPYKTITRDYASLAGETFPVTYWVLPENVEPGKVLFEDILRQMRFFEEVFGPYPFRADKYGVAETPHLGMEHQSIIAYGNRYQGNPWGRDYGFDMLHLHEFAHEWWANLVTAKNWNDFWIHEGFASYAQALYVEHLHGKEGYREEMLSMRGGITNARAVAPREPRTATQMYTNSDIYPKGAWIVHMLRFLMGDEVFFQALRRMAYPDPELEKAKDGSACRFATTEEIHDIAEKVSGQELDWFFEVYVRQSALPRLVTEKKGRELRLRWEVPNDLPFPMPVELEIGGERVRVDVPEGGAMVERQGEIIVDPDRWLLMEES